MHAKGFIQAGLVMSNSSATLQTVACQVPLSVGFSRQEYWSGLPFPPSGDLPTQGSNPHLSCLLHWQAGSTLNLPPNRNKVHNK